MKRSLTYVIVILLYAVLAACGASPASTPALEDNGATVEPTETAATETPPTEPAGETSAESAMFGVTDDSDPGTVDTVNVYLIAQQDNGARGDKIGCDDSVVAVQRTIEPTGRGIGSLIGAALRDLLSIKEMDFEGGLYNSLYLFTLDIGVIQGLNGAFTVELSGEIGSSGLCEGPRIVAQMVYTARQFPSVKSVQFLVNGEDLEGLVEGP